MKEFDLDLATLAKILESYTGKDHLIDLVITYFSSVNKCWKIKYCSVSVTCKNRSFSGMITFNQSKTDTCSSVCQSCCSAFVSHKQVFSIKCVVFIVTWICTSTNMIKV